MSKRPHPAPETPATRLLRQQGIEFTTHLYDYVEHGGTRVSAAALGVEEHAVIKTLVMEDERASALIVLMHGDCSVSTKNLARAVGVKRIEPCRPEIANRHSGYLVGGTSPFATRRKMPVYMESSISSLQRIYINGGRRGFLLGLAPGALFSLLEIRLVEVAVQRSE